MAFQGKTLSRQARRHPERYAEGEREATRVEASRAKYAQEELAYDKKKEARAIIGTMMALIATSTF